MLGPANVQRLVALLGDITQQQVEAIVNAANSSLLGGGGVDGAIHRGAGPRLLAECRTIGGCPAGQARITRGYDLPAQWVIHTVGPVWHGGKAGEPAVLASAYRSCMQIAEDRGIRTIAFPSISTGAYGYPVRPAAEVAVCEVARFLSANAVVEQVTFVCFDDATLQIYLDQVAKVNDDKNEGRRSGLT